MVGTRKGLWIGQSDEAREDWEFTGPHFDMEEVYSCMIDTRGDRPRLLAGASSMWLGPQVRHSDDLGAHWEETPNGAIRFPEGADATVARIWQLVPGAEPGVVYAGTEPGAVWKSTDGGETFALERALWDHPHRPQWNAGFGGQAFHTMLPHPTDPQSVTAAISTGGVYQTSDGGASWEPRNQGIRAEFMPEGEQYPEFGQCVHKVTRHPAPPERLFLQNHGGVYRSDDHGELLEVDRRRPARRVRLPDRGPPARPRHDLRLPDQRRRRALPARRQGPGVALARRGRLVGGARPRGCRRRSSWR